MQRCAAASGSEEQQKKKRRRQEQSEADDEHELRNAHGAFPQQWLHTWHLLVLRLAFSLHKNGKANELLKYIAQFPDGGFEIRLGCANTQDRK